MPSTSEPAPSPLLALLLALGVAAVRAEEPVDPSDSLEQLEVVGTTPLGGAADADRVASSVQTASAEDIRRQGALDLADFMKRSFGGVFVNEAQSNPLQPDVQYRGFVGSALLGLPQGLAVYQDGVRINEPFGDTVNWALIPESAIDRVYLIPGSNPLFGLNSLGGALSVETKDGFTAPGTRVEVFGGSWSRLGVEAQTGGSVGGRFGYFVAGSTLSEDGWRDFSPTRATQGFAKVGWQGAATNVEASVTYADTDLTGNGAAPVELLDMDASAVFTHPDETRNRLGLFAVSADRAVTGGLRLSGNVYYRGSDIHTVNGDTSDFGVCDAQPALICDAEDEPERPLLDEAGRPVRAAAPLLGGTMNRTRTDQKGSGAALQLSWSRDVAGRPNRLLAGVAYDHSDVSFEASLELASLDATRGAVPGGVFVQSGLTRLRTTGSNLGVYVSDIWAVTPAVTLTVAGRSNRSEVDLRDRAGTSLDGRHAFRRLNPALGLTFAISDETTFYAGYSESNRAPSPVELTCADADAPCRLPNAFVADPPLEQVVAKTVEIGIRGRSDAGRWHAGVFDTLNEDDILFVSAGALTNEGYFGNVGRTRRRGVELGIDRSGQRLSWFANYTFLQATFEDPVTLQSVNNPRATDGEIFVSPGDRLPLVPGHLLKAGVQIEVASKVTIGGDVLASGEQFLRGDEANLVAPLDAYALVNLHARYRLNEKLELFANVDNLFDAGYETFGVFGDAAQALGEEFVGSRFVSPGAPRAAWVGVRLSF